MNSSHNGCCCHDSSDNNSDNGHSCGGGCGCGGHQSSEIQISEEEIDVLKQLSQTPYLPLTRFILQSSQSDHLESVALAPVYLNSRDDSMETVKHMGTVLKALESKELISLDYEEPLENGNYDDYMNSSIYAYFKETAAHAKAQDGFLFDIPILELGSISLTSIGQMAIDQLDELIDADTEN